MARLASFVRFRVHVCGLAVAGLTVLVCAAFPVAAVESKSAGPSVLVFGDSLSAGYGLRAEEGWVSLMAQRLAQRGTAVVNASVSGETTSGGLSRIKSDLERHKPSVVVLALGANDGLRGLPVAQTRQNLALILDQIRQRGATAVLVGIQIPPNYGIQYTNDFKSLFAQLAAERKLLLVPFLLDGIAENLDNFQPDRLHPIAATQPRVLRNVLPVVERALPKPQAASR